MKIIDFSKYGTPDDLCIKEVDIPEPKSDEVLVKIVASSINSWDLELLRGTPFANRIFFGLFKPKRLKTLGIDIAGRVEKVGSKVVQFREGDEVYGDLSACGWGGFAEYVAVPSRVLSHKPVNITFEQAAAIPQAGLLALQGLVDSGHIHDGQKILINGASGGSGTLAIAIAKKYDVEITAVCSKPKMDFVRSLGVDHVIDYQHEDFTRNGLQYDLILDAQAHHSIFDYRRALSLNGVYVIHGGATSTINQIMFLGPILSMMGRRKFRVLLHKANKGMDVMGDLIRTGKLFPVIDQQFTLEQVPEAMHYYAQGKTRGKLVIKVAS
ncbi:MAG: NAD(P)-dependent alcohol dehydrogenase [Gammaproteobacteria bacterium]|nr:NAD(P)-dependent alcohol dehydrogenase [Gammaproteobacteria bacterium]